MTNDEFKAFGDHLLRKTAEFSPCRTYRYVLSRSWNPNKSLVLFIGLNPSTADETMDDPTVRRCIQYAHGWGYGGLIMANIFAFRATDPRIMKQAKDPIGPANDMWLQSLLGIVGLRVAAWGNHGEFMGRGKQVLDLLGEYPLHCLGITKQGHPRHPLFLKKTLEPTLMRETCGNKN